MLPRKVCWPLDRLRLTVPPRIFKTPVADGLPSPKTMGCVVKLTVPDFTLLVAVLLLALARVSFAKYKSPPLLGFTSKLALFKVGVAVFKTKAVDGSTWMMLFPLKVRERIFVSAAVPCLGSAQPPVEPVPLMV